MNMDWLTALRNFGASVYDAVVFAPPLLLFFAALSLPILGWFVLHFYRNVARNVEAIFRILTYRTSQALGSWKTRAICRFRELFPQRRKGNTATRSEVEFDDLDLAVLRTAATLGPGFAINAAELAERLRVRPAQAQRSLSKLSNNKMLDSAIGSNAGFDNYCLTQLGSAFMSTWQRRASQA